MIFSRKCWTMLSELGLNKPGWKSIFADKSASGLLSQFFAAAQSKEPAGQLQLFKTTTGRRRIYLFSPQPGPEKFLIKAYLPARFSKRLKYLVRNSRCRQEFFVAEKLAELGVPAVKAAVFAFRRKLLLPAEEFVIEPFLEGCKSFEDLWKELGPDERKKLFASLSDFIGNMHKLGVLQRDFKPDSILAKNAGNGFELILSDLERIRFYPGALSKKRRIANLGKIVQSFFRVQHRPEMDWLLQEYSAKTGLNVAEGELRKKVILSGVAQIKKLAQQRQSWAWRTNELIQKFETQGMEFRVSREIGKPALEEFLTKNRLNAGSQIDINGKRLDLVAVNSGRKTMEKYFYLRELRINTRPVLLAVDFENRQPAIAGILNDSSEKHLAEALSAAAGDEKAKLLTELGSLVFRLQLFGIGFPFAAADSIRVKKSGLSFELALFRPDLFSFAAASQVKIPCLQPSSSAQKMLSELIANPSEAEVFKQGFSAAKENLFHLTGWQSG